MKINLTLAVSSALLGFLATTVRGDDEKLCLTELRSRQEVASEVQSNLAPVLLAIKDGARLPEGIRRQRHARDRRLRGKL